ncbi:hypothetical protein N0V85_008506 [Neurospora sp. IMI 360204]|nr:hypothetical protein N0V85_008506 [Neurospora sp. IMI 360204]
MSSHIEPINTTEGDIADVGSTARLLQELQNRILQLEEQLKAKAEPDDGNPEDGNPADPPVDVMALASWLAVSKAAFGRSGSAELAYPILRRTSPAYAQNRVVTLQ